MAFPPDDSIEKHSTNNNNNNTAYRSGCSRCIELEQQLADLHAKHSAIELYSGSRTSRSSWLDHDKARDFKLGFDLLLKRLGSNSKDFTEFATVLASIANLRDLDMHGNNMGWRDNGELVISDPLAA